MIEPKKVEQNQINTLDDLGDIILDEIVKLRENRTGVVSSKVVATLAGRAISIVRVCLELYKLNGHKPVGKFLDISEILRTRAEGINKYKDEIKTEANNKKPHEDNKKGVTVPGISIFNRQKTHKGNGKAKRRAVVKN